MKCAVCGEPIIKGQSVCFIAYPKYAMHRQHEREAKEDSARENKREK